WNHEAMYPSGSPATPAATAAFTNVSCLFSSCGVTIGFTAGGYVRRIFLRGLVIMSGVGFLAGGFVKVPAGAGALVNVLGEAGARRAAQNASSPRISISAAFGVWPRHSRGSNRSPSNLPISGAAVYLTVCQGLSASPNEASRLAMARLL